jgi:hypothetical protein
LTTIWPGRHRLDHFAADGLFLHVLDEVADHFKRHVGFDQRAADLAHGGVDVSLGECAPAGQLVEDATEAVLKCFEHQSLTTRVSKLTDCPAIS